MTTITAYKTPQGFLDDTEKILEQKELENNLILGLCNDFADKTREYNTCVFINSIADNQIQASSIKTISKAVVAGTTKNVQDIKVLADYYLDNGINLTGAFGESFYSTEFSNFYGKRQVAERTMIVHKLTSVNNLPWAAGSLEVANEKDIDLVAEWTKLFEEDAKTFPRKSSEEIMRNTQRMIGTGNIFKWVDGGKTVSIAAIVRKTKSFGIVGLVYTPDKFRGKGYATSSVQKLSEHILQSGFNSCGLFTDKSNPTSNNIYKKIGYVPTTEFTDIEYA